MAAIIPHFTQRPDFVPFVGPQNWVKLQFQTWIEFKIPPLLFNSCWLVTGEQQKNVEKICSLSTIRQHIHAVTHLYKPAWSGYLWVVLFVICCKLWRFKVVFLKNLFVMFVLFSSNQSSVLPTSMFLFWEKHDFFFPTVNLKSTFIRSNKTKPTDGLN